MADRYMTAQWTMPKLTLQMADNIQPGDTVYRYESGEPHFYAVILSIVHQENGTFGVTYLDGKQEVYGKHRSEWIAR